MRFDGLDLNLLVALDALLDEQNVSVAGERIRLSQGAMSAALNRLRDYFQDELLVSVGRKMVLTPRAQELVGPVRRVLLEIHASITTKQRFHPATSDRHITIIASDYFVRVVLAEALRAIAQEAPRLTFDVGDLEDDPVERLRRGEVDLMITVESFMASDHPTRLLLEEEYVVAGWAENPALSEPIDKDEFERLGHVTVSHGPSRLATSAEAMLRSMQVSRRIEVAAPGFSEVPYFLIGTNRIAVMHKRLARLLSASMPLKHWPMPFEFPHAVIKAQWNSILTDDEALGWVVDRIEAAARLGD